MFCRALVKSGCRNVNITGGEPFLLPQDYLFEMIESIQSVEGINKLWITTNGFRLCDNDFCRNLAKTGLKEAVVSIAAETDESYSTYTGFNLKLSELLKGIATATQFGIDVRVHVPLSPIGIHSFEQLEILLDKVKASGVKEAFYFRLHNSEKIEEKFNELVVNPMDITNGFKQSNRWHYRETESGRPFYSDDVMHVNIPREQIRLVTENCKSRNCGTFCQGIYSAYCVPGKDGWVLRACHRIFPDKNNEYAFSSKILEHGQESKLQDLLQTIWKYAYE
jgi:molybdenum cofactor biosynthesis enzyme MoaA